MNRAELLALLAAVRRGELSCDAALRQLITLPFQSLAHAHLDTHRELRTGMPEVIFGQGKTRAEIMTLTSRLLKADGRVLVTRLNPADGKALHRKYPSARFLPRSGVIFIEKRKTPRTGGRVVVISAGTSDTPVADEASLTAEACGRPVDRVYDTGVAGLHRLLAHDERIRSARVRVVVAGMEGALPSVVAGLYGGPVIAVPVSIGYGVAAGGWTALAAMLTSCAPGIAVVNIDNGFGAGVLAAQIAAAPERWSPAAPGGTLSQAAPPRARRRGRS